MFSTIIDNIKSFFAREEELSVKPKAIPEAASEVFERPKIIDKPLPAATLPFSPDQLRAAIKNPPVPKVEPKPEPTVEKRDTTQEIHREIAAFEAALAVTESPVKQQAKAVAVPIPTPIPAPIDPFTPSEPEQLFFGEFHQFLKREGMQSDGVLGKDLLWRMKEFHKHRLEGKEYYIYAKDTQAALDRKVSELKSLEREWFAKREQLDIMEKEMHLLENEIESRTSELKQLVRQANAKSKLEHVVAPGCEFKLLDGRKLSSLLDLKAALRNMPDTVFNHHVTATRNDFSSWIRGAMNDTVLANRIATIRDRVQLEMFLGRLEEEQPKQLESK